MSPSRARALIRSLLEAERVEEDCEVSLVFCDDERMRALNQAYRGEGKPTDVLSFAQEIGPTIPGEPRLLGDVVISVPTAERQAAAAGRPVASELDWLLLHGVLHLLGFEDATSEGLEEMKRRQRAVLAAMGESSGDV